MYGRADVDARSFGHVDVNVIIHGLIHYPILLNTNKQVGYKFFMCFYEICRTLKLACVYVICMFVTFSKVTETISK